MKEVVKMINIRPVSDLRNKYPEIEDLVLKEDEAVYLTKNGYGSMVVLSLEKYSKIMNDASLELAISEKFSDRDIEKMLDDTEEEMQSGKAKYSTHEEVFSKARRIIDGEK
jgi:PHD/YefM family antitoxin component YafN of YafNO toxin-antitoxin module